jgi:hypothetical protein
MLMLNDAGAWVILAWLGEMTKTCCGGGLTVDLSATLEARYSTVHGRVSRPIAQYFL